MLKENIKRKSKNVSVTKPASHLQCQAGNGHSTAAYVRCHMMYLNDCGSVHLNKKKIGNENISNRLFNNKI